MSLINRHSLFDVIEESLRKRGFVVIPSDSTAVGFKSGKRGWYEDMTALEYLGKRYYFDLHRVENPFSADIEDLTVTNEILSPAFKRLLGDIESTTSRSVHLSKLEGAPVVFELSGKTYLNVGSELLTKALASFDSYDKSILRSYILGLLRYEIH